jgi:hypothetical protein
MILAYISLPRTLFGMFKTDLYHLLGQAATILGILDRVHGFMGPQTH